MQGLLDEGEKLTTLPEFLGVAKADLKAAQQAHDEDQAGPASSATPATNVSRKSAARAPAAATAAGADRGADTGEGDAA